MHIRKKSYIPVIIMLVMLLTGCTQNQPQTEQIPYDPYSFTPRQFVEEGGWEAARNSITGNLAQLYCEFNSIVIDGGKYEPVLSISGQNYDFGSAVLNGAVYVRNSPNNTDSTTKELNNWLDLAFSIPVEDSKIPASLFVRASDITRTEEGDYICLSISGVTCNAPAYQFKKEIELQSWYVTDDGTVKEEVDYGLIEWNPERDEFEKVAEYARNMEEERLSAYLMSLEKNSSLYFSTTGYEACQTSAYTVDFDAVAVVSDLRNFASGLGMESVDISQLPEKKKTREKEGWHEQTVGYPKEEDAQKVQEYLRSCIREQYFSCHDTRWAFRAEMNENSGNITITIYVNTSPKSEP